jgi:hypothetical protein
MALKDKGLVNKDFTMVPYYNHELDITIYPCAPPGFYNKVDCASPSSPKILEHLDLGYDPIFNQCVSIPIEYFENIATTSASQLVVSLAGSSEYFMCRLFFYKSFRAFSKSRFSIIACFSCTYKIS